MLSVRLQVVYLILLFLQAVVPLGGLQALNLKSQKDQKIVTSIVKLRTGSSNQTVAFTEIIKDKLPASKIKMLTTNKWAIKTTLPRTLIKEFFQKDVVESISEDHPSDLTKKIIWMRTASLVALSRERKPTTLQLAFDDENSGVAITPLTDLVSPTVVRLVSTATGIENEENDYIITPFISSDPAITGAFAISSSLNNQTKAKLKGYLSRGNIQQFITTESEQSKYQAICSPNCTAVTMKSSEKNVLPPEASSWLLDDTKQPFFQDEAAQAMIREASGGSVASGTAYRELEVATEVDWEFMQQNGGSAEEANVTAILNLVLADQMLRSQAKIRLKVVLQHTYSNLDDPYSSNGTAAMVLSQLVLRWEFNVSPYYRYDVAYLFSGVRHSDTSGMTSGWACTPLRYAMSDSKLELMDWTVKAVAHEFGHLLGARHDFEVGVDCFHYPYIMCYEPIPVKEYSQRSVDSFITPHCAEEVSAWPDPVQPPVVSEHTFFTQGTSRAVSLSWKTPSRLAGPTTHYEVWKSPTSNGFYFLTGVTEEPEYRDDQTEANSTYYYSIKSKFLGRSSKSNQQVMTWTGSAKTFDIRAAKGTSPDYISLSYYNDFNSNFSINIYRSQSPIPCREYYASDYVTPENNATADFDPRHGYGYFYSARIVYPDGTLGECGSVSYGYTATPPANPTALAFSTSASGRINLSWKPVSSRANYYLVTKVTGNTPPADCNGGASNDGSGITFDAAPRAHYAFRVCAVDSEGRISSGSTKVYSGRSPKR